MITNLDLLSAERLAFWSRGNYPTQQAFHISPEETLIHLKALYLLADRVAAAASFYFESETTRIVSDQLQPLLQQSDILFFVNEEMENFTEHGLRKMEKSPIGLVAYRDLDRVRELGSKLDAVGTVLHRPDTDISGRIVVLWVQDLLSSEAGSLGMIVEALDEESCVIGYWHSIYASIAEKRSGDFVWEYVEPFLRNAGCPSWAMRATRRRLIQLYTRATAETVAAELDAPSYSARSAPLTKSSEYDTDLFLACLRCVRLLDQFKACSAAELVELKTSIGWRVFRSFYSDLIHYAVESTSDIYDVAPVLMTAERLASSAGMAANTPTRGEFVRAVAAMLQVVTKRRRIREYRKLADRLYAIAEAFGSGAFELLGSSLFQMRAHSEYRLTAIGYPSANSSFGSLPKDTTVHTLRAFIVHGHDITALLELKDFLQNRLGWPEPIILMQRPNQGLTIIEKFEQDTQEIDVVFVLMTPDDMGVRDDEFRARQNVIFELGYFVGKFGRKSGRVILLTKGALDLPSDLAGVLYIDISQGVLSAGEDIRREISRLTSLTLR